MERAVSNLMAAAAVANEERLKTRIHLGNSKDSNTGLIWQPIFRDGVSKLNVER